MNENLNLVEILKDCPKGTKLYSPLVGEVNFIGIEYACDIDVSYNENHILSFLKDGKYFSNCKDGECMLFPSKEQRDWSKFKPKQPKFDPKTLQPFDKVLARDVSLAIWRCQLFSNINKNEENYPYLCVSDTYKYCIPYNDDTKHLVGTNKEAPEYYRYWED